jgi:hypothetical protein
MNTQKGAKMRSRFQFQPVDFLMLMFLVAIGIQAACGKQQQAEPVKQSAATPAVSALPPEKEPQPVPIPTVGLNRQPVVQGRAITSKRFGLFAPAAASTDVCAKPVQNPIPPEPSIIKWSSTSCRDGDYCCGAASQKSAGGHCFGGDPPYCDAAMVGPDITMSSCSPFELGRVKVTGYLIDGKKLTIYLQSDCPPTRVDVKNYLHVKGIQPFGFGADATWFPGGHTSGSVQLEAPEAKRPVTYYVSWPSGSVTQIYSGQIARAGEAVGNRLDLAWKSRGAMIGPIKDYR